MFTILFILGYTSLVAILVAIEAVHWVYTGVSSIAWAEHLLGILLASRLFLQIIIPCIFLDVIKTVCENVINNIGVKHYERL